MGVGSSIIRIVITGDDTGALAALDRTARKTDSTGNKFAGFAKKAAAGFAAAGVAVGVYAFKQGEALQVANEHLKTALDNTNQSWAKNQKAIAGADAQGQKWGFSMAEVRTNMATLVTAGNSVTKAHKLLTTAEDLAAAKHMDLARATLLVTKANEGSLGPLKRQGIDFAGTAGGAMALAKAQAKLQKAQEAQLIVAQKIHDGTLKGKAATAAYIKSNSDVAAAQENVNKVQNAGAQNIAELNKRFHGAAEGGSKTFEGQMKVLHVTIQNFAAKIGVQLIPVIQKLMGVLVKVADYLLKHKALLIALGVILGGTLIAGFIAAASAITGIGIAIAAVVAAAVWLWTNWDQVWNWIKGHPAIAIVISILAAPVAAFVLIIGGLKMLWENWDAIWGAISTTAQDVWNNGLSPVFDAIKKVFQDVVGFVTALVHGDWSTAWSDLSAIPGDAFRAYLAVLNYVWSNAVLPFLRNLPGWAMDALSAWVGLMAGLGGSVIGGLWDGAKWAFGLFIGWVKGIPGAILGGIGSLLSTLASAGGDLAQGLWDGFKAGWNSFAGKTKFHINFDSHIPGIPAVHADVGPLLPSFHTGGVYASGAGEGLALLKDGEGIFTPAQMAALGPTTGGNTYHVHMNVQTMPTPEQLAAALRKYDRRNAA